MLSEMLLYQRPILITSDFNFHVDDSSDKSATSFIDICSAFGLLQHVREPTHCCGHSLDLVLSNEVNVSDLNVSPLTPSDHYYVSFHTQGMALPTIPTNVAWRRNIRSVSRRDIFPSLAEAGLVHSNACTSNQPDEIVAFLNTGLQKAVDAVAPLRPQRLKACNYPFLLSKKLDKMRRRKRKLERRFKKSGSAIYFKNCKAFLSEYVSELRKNKSSFFHKKLSSSCDDPKKAFKTVNFLLNRGKTLSAPSTPDACQLFSSYFVEKIEKIRSSISQPSCLTPLDTHSPPSLASFHAVSNADIIRLVKASKRSSSPADPIPVPLLCKIIDWVSSSITNAINSSLVSGVVPAAFKSAIVRPILKPGSDPELLSNY